jgi:hypothetical protein
MVRVPPKKRTTVFDVVADLQRPQAALVVADAGSLEIEAAAAQHARQRQRREVSRGLPGILRFSEANSFSKSAAACFGSASAQAISQCRRCTEL